MAIGKKLAVLIGISMLFIVEGLWLLIGFITQSVWTCAIASGLMALTIYFLYVRLYQKKEARYPVIPLEGKTDIYFPRTNIPRPVIADFREMEKKKKKLAKMKKIMRRKKE